MAGYFHDPSMFAPPWRDAPEGPDEDGVVEDDLDLYYEALADEDEGDVYAGEYEYLHVE